MFNITSGNILRNVLYLVYGTQNVIYNGATYITGQTFRGIPSITTFTFSGSGTQLLYEVTELRGANIIFDENALDSSLFSDITKHSGFAIEYQQNTNDIAFNDITTLKGFAIELLDFPFYSFFINETNL